MITIKCYYGFRSVQGLTVKTIEEARKHKRPMAIRRKR